MNLWQKLCGASPTTSTTKTTKNDAEKAFRSYIKSGAPIDPATDLPMLTPPTGGVPFRSNVAPEKWAIAAACLTQKEMDTIGASEIAYYLAGQEELRRDNHLEVLRARESNRNSTTVDPNRMVMLNYLSYDRGSFESASAQVSFLRSDMMCIERAPMSKTIGYMLYRPVFEITLKPPSGHRAPTYLFTARNMAHAIDIIDGRCATESHSWYQWTES